LGGREINTSDALKMVKKYRGKPSLYEPGEEKFWDDEYISTGMLNAHLSQEFDAASRQFAVIDREIENLIARGFFRTGDRVLDLGCGPGLYASRLCKRGMDVTGVDISRRSIEYALKQAGEHGQDITYVNGSFFDIGYSNEFDVAMQIYGEIGTFSDEKRDLLLSKIYEVLVPGGLLVFDVSTRQARVKEGAGNHWHIFEGGFWRPGKHIVLEEGFDYPEENVWLDQYIIIDEECVKVYRNWFHDYSLETILPVLEKAGFTVIQIWNDFTGTPFEDGGDWIALVARKS